jgi:hypothetical protein
LGVCSGYDDFYAGAFLDVRVEKGENGGAKFVLEIGDLASFGFALVNDSYDSCYFSLEFVEASAFGHVSSQGLADYFGSVRETLLFSVLVYFFQQVFWDGEAYDAHNY